MRCSGIVTVGAVRLRDTPISKAVDCKGVLLFGVTVLILLASYKRLDAESGNRNLECLQHCYEIITRYDKKEFSILVVICKGYKNKGLSVHTETRQASEM